MGGRGRRPRPPYFVARPAAAPIFRVIGYRDRGAACLAGWAPVLQAGAGVQGRAGARSGAGARGKAGGSVSGHTDPFFQIWSLTISLHNIANNLSLELYKSFSELI